MLNPHTTAERVYQVLGFHLSLLEVLHTPKRAAAEEAGGGIFRDYLTMFCLSERSPSLTALSAHISQHLL